MIDKPSGPTSHDIVVWARRVLREPRIGHCGTLDPMASGLLVLAVADALKAQESVVSECKTYRGKIRFGITTDTDDVTGKVLTRSDLSKITLQTIVSCAKQFQGTLVQRVPRFSAVKFQGRKLYEWARDGVQVKLPARGVEIHRFNINAYSCPDADFDVVCSKGTYVRSLARDLGEDLGVGATLASLTREAIGQIKRENAFRWMPHRPDDVELKKAFISLSAWHETGATAPDGRLVSALT